MPGVMVDELGLGFDSTISSPMFENLMACPSPNAASRALKFFGSDTNSDKFLFGNVPANLNPTMMANFSGLNLYNVTPSSPERGSPRMFDTDGRENIGSKLFSRSLSKFSGNGMTEDMMLRGEAYDEEGVPSENGGDNDVFHALSVADFKDHVNNGAPFPIGAAFDSSGSFVGSPVLSDPIMALQKFLPSNNEDGDVWPSMDFYSSDEFRMYEFKVRRCMRGRSHDWTECPFAHPGEKARRRDPRRFHYSGAACPDFRKGSCRRGDACEFAHGVFECWLHPARYRTQPCKDGRNCKRRVCFFAHTPEQLRLLPASAQAAATSASRSSFYSSAKSPLSGSYDGSPVRSLMSGSYDGSPLRQALAGSLDSQLLDNWPGLVHSDGTCDGRPGSPRANPSSMLCKSGFGYPSLQISSPTSTLAGHSHSPPMLSPPLSPSGSPPLTPDSPNNLSRPSFARCLSGSFQTSLPQTAISQIQGSVSPFLSNSSPMLASPVSTHGLSPLSPTIPSHRRHLDRLHSLPSISVPNLDARDGYSMNSPGADPFDKMHSSQAVNELVATLQNLQLRARAAEANVVSPSSWSLKPSTFSTVSHSLPGSPLKSRWVGQTDPWDTFCEVESAPQRVESGRDLRAKIYAKLSKENPLESESPDLGWVNELVK